MTYKQVVEPNLDPFIYEGGKLLTDWYSWCLAYVKTAFGGPWAGSSAWESWTTRTAIKHTDRNFPVGVKLPIWFSGYSGFGHTAILERFTNGSMKIWSTPVTHKPTADVLSSIEEVERRYGVRYAGWSEDVGGYVVIKPTSDVGLLLGKVAVRTIGSVTLITDRTEEIVLDNNLIDQMTRAYWGSLASDGDIQANQKRFIGQPADVFGDFLRNDPKYAERNRLIDLGSKVSTGWIKDQERLPTDSDIAEWSNKFGIQLTDEQRTQLKTVSYLNMVATIGLIARGAAQGNVDINKQYEAISANLEQIKTKLGISQ